MVATMYIVENGPIQLQINRAKPINRISQFLNNIIDVLYIIIYI